MIFLVFSWSLDIWEWLLMLRSIWVTAAVFSVFFRTQYLCRKGCRVSFSFCFLVSRIKSLLRDQTLTILEMLCLQFSRWDFHLNFFFFFFLDSSWHHIRTNWLFVDTISTNTRRNGNFFPIKCYLTEYLVRK